MEVAPSSVLPRKMAFNTVPYELLKDNQPFKIKGVEHKGDIATIQVVYSGTMKDQFTSIALPHTLERFEAVKEEDISDAILKAIDQGGRYLLLRHLTDSESEVSTVTRCIHARIIKGTKPQFITYEDCTDQELDVVDREKRYQESLIVRLKNAVAEWLGS